MADFLWHEVSESEKKQIEKDAKKIMDNFAKKLERVKSLEEPSLDRKNFERSESEYISAPIDRDIMFNNASNKNKDFILAEKKGW